ncbi:MAG: hypothetical protein GF350_09945 [Chitinivibrionales bacterium]|nr:hypothetical protein [Chitinivibrionales bacterium]
MNSAIFTTASENYQVAQIAFAGPVTEIPEEKRKYSSTHYFKIVNHRGTSYCHFKSMESAKKARNALAAMLNTLKPNCYKYGSSAIDAKSVLSFSNVFSLKTPQNDLTHAFVVTIDTVDEKNSKVWLKFRSEENAWKAQKALFASIYAANNMKKNSEKVLKEETAEVAVVEEKSSSEEKLPF